MIVSPRIVALSATMFLSAITTPGLAVVTCTETAGTASCTGTQATADARISYNADTDGVSAIVIEPGYAGTAISGGAFWLTNPSGADNDLSITMEAGSTLDASDSTHSLAINQQGSGDAVFTLRGRFETGRIVRGLQSSASTDTMIVNIEASAYIHNHSTGVWLGAHSAGGSTINVEGTMQSDDWRVLHVIGNGAVDTAEHRINIMPGASLTLRDTGARTNQAVFVETRQMGSPIVINSAGTVVAEGAGGGADNADGIFARSNHDAAEINITGGSVTGGAGGAIHTASPATSAINLDTINISAGATIDGSAGFAILNGDEDRDGVDENNGNVMVNTAGTLLGAIHLGGGSDTFHFNAGSDFTDVTTIDGGDDADVGDGFIDALNFNAVSGVLNASNVTNWESVAINSGSVITFDGAETLATPELVLSSGGVLSLAEGAVDDVLTVSGDLVGGGTLMLETVLGDSASASDALVVQGDTSGTTTLMITNRGGVGGNTGTADLDGIPVVRVSGASNGTFILGAAATAGGFNYNLVQGSNGDWFLQSASSGVAGTAEAVPTLSYAVMVLLMLSLLGLARRASAFMKRV